MTYLDATDPTLTPPPDLSARIAELRERVKS